MATYYVSTSGDNGNSGLDQDHPWQTLAWAESHATAAGDIIALKKGDDWSSTAAFRISHGGNVGNPITWDGSLWGTGSNAIISSSGNRSGNNNSIVCISHCQNVDFQNIIVDGNDYTCFGITIGGSPWDAPDNEQDNETNIHIHNCTLLDIGCASSSYSNAIMVRNWFTDIYSIEITGCTINGVRNNAIAIYGWVLGLDPGGSYHCTHDIYIANNNITNWGEIGNPGAGIVVFVDVDGGIIEHNVITQGTTTPDDGIQFSSEGTHYARDIDVRYNKVWMTTKPAFVMDNANYAEVDIYYNIFYADSSTAAKLIVFGGSNNYDSGDFDFYNNTCIVSGNGTVVTLPHQAPAGMVDLKNNIFYSGDTGSEVLVYAAEDSDAIAHSYNLYHRTLGGDPVFINNNGSYYYRSTITTWEPTCQEGDPLFTTEFTNLHLQVGSPCISAGVEISSIPYLDYDETTVVDPREIGAYELASSGSSLLTGLLSAWKLDEVSGQALDSHGNIDSTSISVTYDANGKIGRCFTFNGSSNYVNFGDVLHLVSHLTISCWFKTTDVSSNYQGLVTNYDGDYDLGYDICYVGIVRITQYQLGKHLVLQGD